jgi:hypothetical protein
MLTRSRLFLASSLLAIGCGGGGGGGADDDDDGGGDPEVDAGGEVEANTFSIVTDDIEIAPNDEPTYCYYTTIDVDQGVGVYEWSSTMAQGSHHLILYAIDSGPADGTIEEGCDIGGDVGNIPTWLYGAQRLEQSFAFPAPIGVGIAARQKVVVQMHYLNATTSPITAHAEITGKYFAPEVDYTPASIYVTYNTEIDIPAGVGETASAGGSCAVPDGAKFITLSTHAHTRATLLRVRRHARLPLRVRERPRSPGHHRRKRRDRRDVHGDRVLLPRDQDGPLRQQLRPAQLGTAPRTPPVA